MTERQMTFSIESLIKMGSYIESKQDFQEELSNLFLKLEGACIQPGRVDTLPQETAHLSCKETGQFYYYLSGIDASGATFITSLQQAQELTSHELLLAFRYIEQQLAWYQKHERNQKLIYTDDVTTLLNQRFLKVALKQEVARYNRFKQPFSLLFIDLDNFKNVNDQHGHMSGTRTLRQLGRCIKKQVRNVDLVFRYGGDEFIVMLLGAVACEARLIAKRICKTIEQHKFQDGDHCLRLTVSIGVASFPEHASDYTTLLKFADKSMYYSKEAGKNCVTIFHPDFMYEAPHEHSSGKTT